MFEVPTDAVDVATAVGGAERPPAAANALALATSVATLSHAYVRAFYAAYPHRGVWAGWQGCAGQAPDLSLSALQRRIHALTQWERRLADQRMALTSAQDFATQSARYGRERPYQRLIATRIHAQSGGDPDAAPHLAPDLPSHPLLPTTDLAPALAWASVELDALSDACAKELFNLRDWTYYSTDPAGYTAAFDRIGL